MADGSTAPAVTAAEPDLTCLATGVARLFASRELAHDAGPLTRLGNGHLWLDLQQRRARHGYRWIPFLHMGGMLRHRLSTVLRSINQPIEALRLAELEADIKLRTVPRADMPAMVGGWCGDDGPLILADLTVTVRLATVARLWLGQHQGIADWPETWGRKP
jgi:hypothetical protein